MQKQSQILSKKTTTPSIVNIFALSIVGLSLALTGCDKAKQPEANETEVSEANQTQTTDEAQKAYNRIVVMSPDVSNIVLSLDAADKIVGRDAMNKDPTLKDIPTVGTHRNITTESITAVNPDLVIGSYMVQPHSVYERLNGLGIKAVNVAPKEDVDTFANSIATIGNFVGKAQKGEELSKQWLAGMQHKQPTQTRYLLSYDGRIVSGKNTVADELIKRAGGINAAENITGLKPLSREGWLEANPDVVIIAEHMRKSAGTPEEFAARPELATSPAAKNNKVIFWPVQDFLVFGLYSPEVVEKLNQLSK